MTIGKFWWSRVRKTNNIRSCANFCQNQLAKFIKACLIYNLFVKIVGKKFVELLRLHQQKSEKILVYAKQIFLRNKNYKFSGSGVARVFWTPRQTKNLRPLCFKISDNLYQQIRLVFVYRLFVFLHCHYL